MSEEQYQELLEKAEQTLIDNIVYGDIHAVIFFLTRHDAANLNKNNPQLEYKQNPTMLKTKGGYVEK